MKHLRSLILVLTLTPAAFGTTVNPIQNGNFENGYAGWLDEYRTYNILTGSCNTGFVVGTTNAGCPGTSLSDGTLAALSATTIDAGSYAYYISDLFQSFVVPAGATSAVISFSEAYKLTGTQPGGDLLLQLYTGDNPFDNSKLIMNEDAFGPNTAMNIPWTYIMLNVPSFASYAGQTLTLDLRATAGGQGSAMTMEGGFDNVAINFTTTPEPATFALIATGLFLVAFAKR